MRYELQTPEDILEELADKAAVQIDKLAPVAFDAAFDELTRYHRFLLSVYATRALEGDPVNYAAIAGDALRAPHDAWISHYRILFERAASRIGEASDFLEKLAYAPLRLLPRRNDPQLSDDVLRAILNLGPILIHRLEGWVTKRTVADTAPGASASPRLYLAGSDAKAYANLLPNIVSAWEGLLRAAPAIYRWRDEGQCTEVERWNSLRRSWPYLWHHLRNTAYMLAITVWNEDEAGTALFRDALVRWPQTLGHHFHDRAYLLQRRLVFPEIVSLDLPAAQERIRPLLPPHMPAPTPDELFNATLVGAHDDVLLLTAALLLFWSMEGKQATNIGASTASELHRRKLEDPEDEIHVASQDKTFGSIMMGIIRLQTAGDRFSEGEYGVQLDHLVETLDNMTERRVVPGRVFTPSTLRGRHDLQASFLAMLLARAPETDDPLVKRIADLANNLAALPTGDRSLRDVLQSLDRFQKVLATSPPALQRGLSLISPDVDFSAAIERLESITGLIIEAIEQERTARLRAKPIDPRAITNLRGAVERIMLTPPGGIFFFRGFSIRKGRHDSKAQLFTSRYLDLSKAQFVDPPMEWETVGFTKHYAEQVAQKAGDLVWSHFTQLRREPVSVKSRIEQPAFWEEISQLAADVGAEPMLLVSSQAEGRALREFVYRLREPPGGLTIESKDRQEVGQSYIATVEGVDVYGADFPPGTAWLFSPYILESVEYATMDADEHIVTVVFQPGEDLKGPLIAEFRQRAIWADWVIYDIQCEDPPEYE